METPRSARPRRPGPRRLAVLAVAAGVALVAAACGGDNSGSAQSPDSTAARATATPAAGATTLAPKTGGSLTYAEYLYPPCLDVALNGGRGSTATNQVVDTLTDQDSTGKIIPRLADSWEVSPDAKSFTFHLHPGVTFSDGTPFNAAVVKANLDTLVDLNKQAKTDTLTRSALRDFTAATAVDDLTVKVDFAGPSLGFLRNASDPYLGMLSSATLALPATDRCAGKLVGTGPFVLASAVINQEIVLKRRADYAWGPATNTHQGAAYLDQITYKIVPEDGTRVGGLTSGQFQAADVIPVDSQSEVKESGASVVTAEVPGLIPGLRQNPYSPFGGDVAIRQAIQKGIDRGEINDTLYGGAYKVASSAIASVTPYYVDLSSDLAYDPDGAKKLLDADGWVAGSDGVRAKNGVKLAPKVIFTAGSTAGATQADLELIQQQLARIGIAIQLVPVTAAQYTDYIADIKSATYDFLTGSGPSKDSNFLVGLFKNTNPALGGADQPELEAAANAVSQAADEASRAEQTQNLQKLLVSKGYWIPVREQTFAVGVDDSVHGFRFDSYGQPVFVDTWLG